jgi:integrase
MRKPLTVALSALIAQQELGGVSDGGVTNTTNRGAKLMQHFGTRFDLRQLTTQGMVGYAADALAAKRAPTTVNADLDTLGQAARAVGIVPPKRPRVAGGAKKQEPLTREQVRLFFMALPYGQRLLGIALITLGPRASEIAKIDDIDWEARTLWVYGTKTAGSRRQLPIPDELFAHMKELERWGQWKGFPKITRQAIDKTVRKACKRAGIGPRSVNDLRGTWATLAALDGVSAEIRAVWQGNSPQMQARVYSQPGLMPEEMRHAARVAPRLRSNKTLALCTGYVSADPVSAANPAHDEAQEASESQAK